MRFDDQFLLGRGRGLARPTPLAACAALFAVALVLAREFAYGPGFGPDSVIYVKVARNLLDGEFFVQRYGTPYSLAAPLYPALLAAGSLSVFDPKDAITPLNAAISGATVFVAGKWLAGRIRSRFLWMWSAVALACSHPLVWAGSIGFPVALFILNSTLALTQADDYFRSGKRSSLAWASLFSALAWLTHYTGIAIVVSVGALLLARPRSGGGGGKLAALYALVSSVPMAAWLAGVIYRTRDAALSYQPVDYSILTIAGDTAAAVSKWAFVNLFVDSLYPEPTEWPIATALAAAALLALAAGIGYGVVRAAFDKGAGGALWERWGSVFVFGGFALTFIALYWAALFMGQTWEGAQDRHLAPAYLPLFIAAALGLDHLIGRAGGRELLIGSAAMRISLPPVAKALLLLWLGLALALHLVAIQEANAYGITRWDVGNYGERRWARSETIAYMIERPLRGEVYTNQADALALYAPDEADPLVIPDSDSFAGWIEGAPAGSGVVWFFGGGSPSDLDAPDLRATPGLEAETELADGVVFAVNKARDPRPALRSAYDALARQEPAARSTYDLYMDGRTLTYAKSPCGRDDGAAQFFLHIVPADPDILSDERRPIGFDNLDFSFESRGVRFDGKCVVSVELPSYAIAEIRTGQFAGEERFWEADVSVGG